MATHAVSDAPAPAAPPRPRNDGVPWSATVRTALVSTLLVTLSVLFHVVQTGNNPVSLVNPGRSGPAAAVVQQDFPNVTLPSGLGHDGQQFYAVARSPMHLSEVSRSLDRPRYRLQRPLYPLLAWGLHPSGGGLGLVVAMLVVNIAAMLAGAVATGVVSHRLGGSPALAALFPLLPGSWFAMRISTADLLALALTMGSVAYALSGRRNGAITGAVLAVLAKESSLVSLVGQSAARLPRRTILPALSAAAVAVGWWLLLHLLVAANNQQVVEFAPPFQAIWRSVGPWVHGEELPASLSMTTALVLGGLVVLRQRPARNPLWWPVVLNLGFLLVLGSDVIGPEANGSRAAAPLLLLAAVSLASAYTSSGRKKCPV